MVANKVRHLRKHFFVKKGFQLKYVGIILAFTLFTIFFVCLSIYYTVFPYLFEKLSNVYPQNRLVAVLANANIKLLYSVLFLIPICVWLGIMLSHKIAGPWQKLEGILLDMASGNIAEDMVYLRKDDELKSLAIALNKLISSLRTRKKYLKQRTTSISQSLENINTELKKESLDKDSLERVLGDLKRDLEKVEATLSS